MRPAIIVVIVLALAPASTFAQQPPRPPDAVKSDAARTVTLTLTEYNRLADLASRPPQPPPVAPVGAVLTSADLRIRVERDTVRGLFNLTGDVLRPGINSVTLVSGATLIDGSAAGRPVPLMADANSHAALLPGPGPFALTLDWGAPLAFTPGRASFVLPVPPAGAAHATVDLPGDQADVRFSAGLVTRRASANGRTIVDVTLKPGAATDVSWSMRDSAPAAAARDVRMLADVMTLVTLGDSDVRMVSLIDVTVAQGEPRTIDVQLPPGYELTSATGSSLESSEPRDARIVLTLGDPSLRRHQFLISLERAHGGGSFTLDTDVPTLPTVQRERGEIAVEGVGTLELAATERGGAMHRMDVRELNASVQSLARLPILSAFRYQRTAGAAIGLAMDVKRFGDASVLAAIADSAVATTLITSEGRALTEVALRVRNRAQPFLKVALPAGATMVSVEIAGEAAKPVLGADGTRVPLLRSGFRPDGVYTVSFVYLHAGTPFARKGELEMALPRMDIPVGVVQWEVFVPDSYTVRAVDGNVIDPSTYPTAFVMTQSGVPAGAVGGVKGGVGAGVSRGKTGGIVGGITVAPPPPAAPAPMAVPPAGRRLAELRGRAIDSAGAVLPGVTVTLDAQNERRTAVTATDGSFAIAGVPAGPVTLTAELSGFAAQRGSFALDGSRRVTITLSVGDLDESASVVAETPSLDRSSSTPQKAMAPSQNVIDLQRRAAGVLPIRVDVPRAGTSHQFVKALVVDQEATVKLQYKRR